MATKEGRNITKPLFLPATTFWKNLFSHPKGEKMLSFDLSDRSDEETAMLLFKMGLGRNDTMYLALRFWDSWVWQLSTDLLAKEAEGGRSP